MDSTLSNEYAEVSYILDILGKQYRDKVPKDLLDLFENNKNNNYDINIDLNSSIDNINVSRNALIIISILNFKYWETNEKEKQRLKNIYDKNEQIYQEKINVYKNNDWLKKKRQTYESTQIEEKCLIVKQESSIWKKIKDFIKNIFNR